MPNDSNDQPTSPISTTVSIIARGASLSALLFAAGIGVCGPAEFDDDGPSVDAQAPASARLALTTAEFERFAAAGR